MLPLLAVLSFLFGYFDEVRAYYEVYPVVFLLMAGSICELGRPVEAAPAAEQSETPTLGTG